MHTDSSASFTYLASVSASECTTTVRMPNSRHARWMRSAISPRLAISIFLTTSLLSARRRMRAHEAQRPAASPAVGESPVPSRLFDQEERLAGLDRLAGVDEALGPGSADFRLELIQQLPCFDCAE